MSTQAFIDELRWRGLLTQVSDEQGLLEYLDSGCQSLYCGFDPTADSLHVGSLVPLLALRRFQLQGHRPLLLLGGATGMIGDPSGRDDERSLNAGETVSSWIQALRVQVSGFLEFDTQDGTAAKIVNNLDWTHDLPVIDFLRDIGKHFSVNSMIQKESVKQRLDREGAGISFTEFTYMMLQSFDFAELYQRHGCTIQIGGSDQWGNITGGIDLTRRMHQAQVFGATLPLVTKADGTKFGKTESGTIWLDESKTSPYAFYQFWLNTADADVYKFLKYFTFLGVDDIDQIERADAEAQGRKSAQGVLAKAVTELVHGADGLAAAMRISEAMFSGDIHSLTESDLAQLQLDGLPSAVLEPQYLSSEAPLTNLFVGAGLAKNGKQVKDALSRNAVLVNGEQTGWEQNMAAGEVFAADRALFGKYYIVRLGKKSYGILTR